MEGFGFIIADRSSMAAKGIMVSGGVIDSGYTGELSVLLTFISPDSTEYCQIKAGDKIAQLIPVKVRTGRVVRVDHLRTTDRGENGFGSSGR